MYLGVTLIYDKVGTMCQDDVARARQLCTSTALRFYLDIRLYRHRPRVEHAARGREAVPRSSQGGATNCNFCFIVEFVSRTSFERLKEITHYRHYIGMEHGRANTLSLGGHERHGSGVTAALWTTAALRDQGA